MKVDVTVSCPVYKSFRVDQVAGMFDLKLSAKANETFAVELPGDDEDWKIGVIVGPSGSGKSTVAREAYGKQLVEHFTWKKDAAVVDNFGNRSIKEITHLLTSVGFSSPPAWLKPYRVLSGGQRFRCDLARALLTPGDLVAFDEFTSVVDRTVAKVGSAAIAKVIRKGRIAKRFVAVTCHYDVLEWLEPDWVLDMASGQLARGCLWRRPEIAIEIAPIQNSAWELFRQHHYLNTKLVFAAKSFAAFYGDEPVAFSAWMHSMTNKRRSSDMREHRTVVLPDYQGIGIGNRLSEWCASYWRAVGCRAFSTTSHPGMIHYRSAAPHWKRHRFSMVSKAGKQAIIKTTSVGRYTAGFQYVGPPMDSDLAKRIAGGAPRMQPRSRRLAILRDVLQRAPGAVGLSYLRRHAPGIDSAALLPSLIDEGSCRKIAIGRGRVAYEATGRLAEPSRR